MHHTACGPASAWKTTQRYVGAQRTRAKCRRCFTVLSQHDASPRLVHLPGRPEDGPGGARPIRGRELPSVHPAGVEKSWRKQGGVLADRNKFNQPETLPSFLNRRPLPAICKDPRKWWIVSKARRKERDMDGWMRLFGEVVGGAGDFGERRGNS